jgi:hypothetical protein
MVTEIKLGLCNPPEPIYLFVNQGEVDGESFVWYKFNISQETKIPVIQRALTGYLCELRLTTKEFQKKDNLKLDIVVSADEVYVIRTGVETNFAKSFLLAASLIQDFSKPLIIAATAGEQNTVFCNLYDAATKTKIYREWSRDGAFSNFVMSRPFEIEISESQEELEKALRHATSASSKERLQMLYWLKSGQVSSRRSLVRGYL